MNRKIIGVTVGTPTSPKRIAEEIMQSPKAIDLSAFDTEGKIVETYDDKTKTTTMEFDESGNPVKITDGDGNVTVLTW